jgi:hypothetical protein
VNYLRESDGPAFDRMMNAILDGRAFAKAMDVGYHDDAHSLWQQFVRSSADRKMTAWIMGLMADLCAWINVAPELH